MSRRILWALLGLVLVTSPARAQDAPSEDIEEIEILGVRPGALERLETASSDTIFTEDAKGENATLADLLGGVGGLWVRRLGGRGEPVELSIRGSAPNQVVLTLDGVPVNNALTGIADAADYCLPSIERVDVVRGAGASQVGSGAIGGVVDLRSQSGGEPRTRATFAGGAFDTFEGSVQHARDLGELGVALGYCGFRTNGDFEFARPTITSGGFAGGFDPDEVTRMNNERVRHGANAALSHPLGPGELRLTDLFTFVDGGTPGIDSGNGPIAGQALEAERRNLSNLAILEWSGTLGLGEDRLIARAHHRFEENRFEDPIPGLGPPIDSRARVSTFGAQLREAWTFDALGSPQDLAVFADVTRDELRANDQPSRERDRGGAGVETTLRAFDERVVLTAGVRVDAADGFAAQWLPQFGLAWTPLRWLRVTANAGRAYRIPNFNELFLPNQGFIRGNPALDAEDAWNFDAGVALAFDRVGPLEDVDLRGGVFRRDIDDSVVWVRSSPFTIEPINTGPAVASGFEASLAFAITPLLRVRANHTHLDTERDATGRSLPGQPEHESFVRVVLGPEDAFKLVGELQDTGEILVNEGGSLRLPSRTVWNASVSVNLAAVDAVATTTRATEIWAFFAIDNLSDEAVRDAVSFPQPGRQASAGLEVAW